MRPDTKYDVALSFAGEDRYYVKEVAEILKSSEVKVFYDKFEESELWGKNLYTYLGEIYKNHAKYTVIFCSKYYNEKLWTNHERESAQERAFREHSEYILPAKLDDTEIPGLKSTIAYIDLRKKTPYELCELICKKLKIDIIRKESSNNKPNRDINKHFSKKEEPSETVTHFFLLANKRLLNLIDSQEKNETNQDIVLTQIKSSIDAMSAGLSLLYGTTCRLSIKHITAIDSKKGIKLTVSNLTVSSSPEIDRVDDIMLSKTYNIQDCSELSEIFNKGISYYYSGDVTKDTLYTSAFFSPKSTDNNFYRSLLTLPIKNSDPNNNPTTTIIGFISIDSKSEQLFSSDYIKEQITNYANTAYAALYKFSSL